MDLFDEAAAAVVGGIAAAATKVGLGNLLGSRRAKHPTTLPSVGTPRATAGASPAAHGSPVAADSRDALHGRCVGISNKWSDRAVDVDKASRDDGAGVNQWRYHSQPNQHWWLYLQPDKSYAIFAKHSGKALSVADWSLENFAPLVQWTWGNNMNQKWWITPLDAGSFRIVNVNSGKALDGTWQEGDWAKLVQWEWHGADNQRWWIWTVE